MGTTLQDLSQRASRYSINLDGQIQRDGAYPPLCGGFADVYRGSVESTGGQVAIKTLRAGLASDVAAIKRAFKEVHLWSKLKHDNILPLLGITTDFDFTVSIVSPWMQVGDAFSHVQNKEVDPRPLLEEIASGLCYLHGHDPQIFHGDLKGLNVLISADGHALLADFGLSSLVDSSFSLSINAPSAGTMRWMSPEVIENYGTATAEGDVWAFGMTALELFTREFPFSAISSTLAVLLRVMQGPPDRPSPESTCLRLMDEWWSICLACWNRDPSARPPMSKILTAIKAVNMGTGIPDGLLESESIEGSDARSAPTGSDTDDSKTNIDEPNTMLSKDHLPDIVPAVSESFSSFRVSVGESTNLSASFDSSHSDTDETEDSGSLGTVYTESQASLSMEMYHGSRVDGANTKNSFNVFASGGNESLSGVVQAQIYV
ncbi:hypothetical protein SCLCIDRAFT_1216613 [Scleroderma citrinum Foug A]|uniref:Protein kinase domain-containing protein n=1 Tax=Scleroderma citrinum Foug A TaxID=1036808 RepID=A0A0C3DX29_9AGAM|nr:hypothetical protein SCLCIDRAFT_1216613 [Scleroderma citrinum Foug A]